MGRAGSLLPRPFPVPLRCCFLVFDSHWDDCVFSLPPASGWQGWPESLPPLVPSLSLHYLCADKSPNQIQMSLCLSPDASHRISLPPFVRASAAGSGMQPPRASPSLPGRLESCRASPLREVPPTDCRPWQGPFPELTPCPTQSLGPRRLPVTLIPSFSGQSSVRSHAPVSDRRGSGHVFQSCLSWLRDLAQTCPL